MSRVPWAHRQMRGMQPARDCAVAAEQILQQYVADPVALDRILNMIEMSVNQQLQQLVRGGSSSTGFDPVTGTPSRSRLPYRQENIRNEAQLRQAYEQERQGRRPPPANQGVATPQHSDMVADPAASLEQESARYQQRMPPQPQRLILPEHPPNPRPPIPEVQRVAEPNAPPKRPDTSSMPWL